MTDEIRLTSKTGGQKGTKAQRYDLLPRRGLDVISEVFAFGATKYADHNWRRKYPWDLSYAAVQRHLTAWWDGEDVDPESGLSHLGHAGFHILVLATWEREDGSGIDNENDTRWPHGLERARREEGEGDGAGYDPPPAAPKVVDFVVIQDKINEAQANLLQHLALQKYFNGNA